MMEWIQRAVITIFCILSMHTAWAEVRVLDLHNLQSPLSVKNGDELLISLAIPAHQYQVVWVKGNFVSARVWLENNNGKVIQDIRSRDFYLRQRLFITHENCGSCKLRISIWTEHPGAARLQVKEKTFSFSNQLRFLAEKQLQKVQFAIDNPEKSKYVDLWWQIYLSAKFWMKLRDEDEFLNSLSLLVGFTDGDRAESKLVLFRKYPDGFSVGFEEQDLVCPLALLLNDYQYNPIMESLVSNDQNPLLWILKKQRSLFLRKMDVASLVRTNIGFGREEFLRGNYASAKYYYHVAKLLIATLPDGSHKKYFLSASVQDESGQLATKLENYDLAESEFNDAFTNFSLISDASYMAEVLNSQGFMNRLQSKLSQATAEHQVAFKLSHYGADSVGLDMRTLYHLGVINASRGRYFTAMESLNKAAVIAEKLDVVQWYAHITAAKARINLELGQFREAEALYFKAKELYQSVSAKADLPTVYINLGLLYAREGNIEKSEFYLGQAKSSSAELTDQQNLNLKQARVSALMGQGDYSEAYEAQEKLLGQVSSDEFFQGKTLSRLAEIAIHQGDFELALNHAMTAIKLHPDKRDELNFIKSNYLAALSSFKLGRSASQVMLFLDKALNGIEIIRASIFRNDMRREFFSLQRKIYDLKVQVYVESQDPDSSLKALLAAESFRGRTLYETFLQQNEKKPLESYRELTTGKLLEKILEDSDLTIDKATSIFQSGNIPISRRASVFQTIDEYGFYEYQEQLKESEATLYYFYNQELSYVWLIRRNSLMVYKIDSGKENADLLEQVIADLSHPPGFGVPPKKLDEEYKRRLKLSGILLGNLGELLSTVDELTIISDGLLHQLPFVVLLDPSKEELLLNTHSIAYGLSLATDSWLRQSRTSMSQSGALMVVANSKPSFGRSGLPYVQEEISAIASLWEVQKKRSVTALIDNNATKENMAALNGIQYEIVHFAGHAKVDWDSPGRTAIFLASDKDDDSARLMVDEIIRWRLNAELVVLSACETARGRLVDGEGNMGLSRAFFEAGARRVVASFWPVKDSSSAYFMGRFYQSLLQHNKSPLYALQEAQRAVSNIPRWSHPYYWSSMAYFGNREAWRE